MKWKVITLIVIFVIALPIIVVLNTYENRPTIYTVDIRGTITNYVTSGDSVTILVEGEIENTTKYDIASVRVDKNTMITKNFESKKLNIDVLKIGTRVEVTFIGPVAESYPVQAVAQAVNIIEWGE